MNSDYDNLEYNPESLRMQQQAETIRHMERIIAQYVESATTHTALVAVLQLQNQSLRDELVESRR
jgi:hypothetical protein